MASFLTKVRISNAIDFIGTNRVRNVVSLLKLQNASNEKQVEIQEEVFNSIGLILCLQRGRLLDNEVKFENFIVSKQNDKYISTVPPIRLINYLNYLKEEIIIDDNLFTDLDKKNIDYIIDSIKSYNQYTLEEIKNEKPFRNSEIRREFLEQIPNYSRYIVLDNTQQPTSFYIHWNDWIDFIDFLRKNPDCKFFLGDTSKLLMEYELNESDSWFLTLASRPSLNYRVIADYINFQRIKLTIEKKVEEVNDYEFLYPNDMSRVLTPEDTLDFGKNEGLTLAEIYHHQLSYIEWEILEISDFKIDIEAFEKLPNPRPDNYRRENFTDKGLAKGLSARDWFKHKDMSNQFINVREIIQFQKENNIQPKEIVYRFPENIKEINNAK